jgi:hypothetical protein
MAADFTTLTLPGIDARLTRIETVVDGDTQQDVAGLRSRLTTVETTLQTLVDVQREMQWILRGVAIGVGLIGVTQAGPLGQAVTTLLHLFGVKP